MTKSLADEATAGPSERMRVPAGEVTAQPMPIFVVGMNRSGTKWLSNLVGRHSDVCAIQSERHRGIIETNLFGQMQQAVGDIRRREQYVAFVELWASTDFFRAAQVEKEFFYQVRPRPQNCWEAFRLLMNEVARRRGKRCWLQKTSPLQVESVLAHFPDARFIIIQRGMQDTLRSELQFRLSRKLRGASLARGVVLYVLQDKILRRVRACRDVCYVTYEGLTRDLEAELGRICGYLQIAFQPAMLESGFERNSSFAAPDQRGSGFKLQDRLLMSVLVVLAKLFPGWLLHRLRAPFVQQQTEFVAGSFGDLVQQHGLSD